MNTFDSWDNELYHYGVPGQRWGIRRFQNEDGSYTKTGLKRYFGDNASHTARRAQRDLNRLDKKRAQAEAESKTAYSAEERRAWKQQASKIKALQDKIVEATTSNGHTVSQIKTTRTAVTGQDWAKREFNEKMSSATNGFLNDPNWEMAATYIPGTKYKVAKQAQKKTFNQKAVEYYKQKGDKASKKANTIHNHKTSAANIVAQARRDRNEAKAAYAYDTANAYVNRMKKKKQAWV